MGYLSIGSQLGTGGELTLSEEVTVQELDGIAHANGTLAVSTDSVWQGLVRGTANQVLTVNSGGTDIEWASGGGGTVSTPTGTVDGSNTSFTASATPLFVISDGIVYVESFGYSLSGLTITMTSPPVLYIRILT